MDTITLLRTNLRASRGDWPTLCKATGLSYWWLTKFAQGRIAEPGLSKIEKLQGYFALNPVPQEGDIAQRPGAANTDEGDAAQANGTSIATVSEAA